MTMGLKGGLPGRQPLAVAHVRELGLLVPGKQHIARLEVPVYYPLVVQRGKAPANPLGHLHRRH